MPVEMEIADDRHTATGIPHAGADFGDGRRGFRRVHGHPNQFGAGFRELYDLIRRGRGVGGIGIGHGLDNHGGAAADLDVADHNASGAVSWGKSHIVLEKTKTRLRYETRIH
ncbi:MAG: hypothetical protein AMXMBFR4_05010 [Candidatus Hydrogenedentota bacterium]